MEPSECCQAELKLEYRIEHLHGCDDVYELKVPCFVCSECNAVYGLVYAVESKS